MAKPSHCPLSEARAPARVFVCPHPGLDLLPPLIPTHSSALDHLHDPERQAITAAARCEASRGTEMEVSESDVSRCSISRTRAEYTGGRVAWSGVEQGLASSRWPWER